MHVLDKDAAIVMRYLLNNIGVLTRKNDLAKNKISPIKMSLEVNYLKNLLGGYIYTIQDRDYVFGTPTEGLEDHITFKYQRDLGMVVFPDRPVACQCVPLSGRKQDLFEYVIDNKGRTLTYDELLTVTKKTTKRSSLASLVNQLNESLGVLIVASDYGKGYFCDVNFAEPKGKVGRRYQEKAAVVPQ
jgi:hypothetical protein